MAPLEVPVSELPDEDEDPEFDPPVRTPLKIPLKEGLLFLGGL